MINQNLINPNKTFLEFKHTRFLFARKTAVILTACLTESHNPKGISLFKSPLVVIQADLVDWAQQLYGNSYTNYLW